MDSRTISPLELNLNSEGFVISKDKVDSSDKISNVDWYDVVKFKVRSLRLDDEGKYVIINENSASQRKFAVDDDGAIFTDKNSALNAQFELNEEQRKKNATAAKKMREQISDYEERIEELKMYVEKSEEVNEFFETLAQKTADGEIYQSE